MTSNNEEYRAQLIEAVRSVQAKHEVKEMTDQQLREVICSGLGLPLGTTFTDEQLEMIAKHR
jgi:hypothetical protein